MRGGGRKREVDVKGEKEVCRGTERQGVGKANGQESKGKKRGGR